MNSTTKSDVQNRISSHLAWRCLVFAVVVMSGVLALAYYYLVKCDGEWSGVATESTGTPDPATIEDRLKADVAFMQSLGPRHLGTDTSYAQLTRCADWIAQQWEMQGYRVQRHEFAVSNKICTNLEIQIPGSAAPSEIVIISAQYDTLPNSPGANNNASGVAVLLRLSELLRNRKLDRTVRLIQFVNEEDPFFGTEHMGSYVYAKASHERGDNIQAMLSLDSIGIYKHTPGSQRLPWPFSLFYPDRGNFLAFIGNLSSRQCVKVATRGFRKWSSFPIAAGLAPEWVKGVTWSDHSSFWRFGYPAVQVTDTGAFRSEFHTTAGDTMDKMDFGALARITIGLCGATMELADKQTRPGVLELPGQWLLFNGTVVLLVGLLAGLPLWWTTLQNTSGTARGAWRVAHATLVVHGVWMLCVATALPRLDLTHSARWVLAWSMIGAGYGFVIAMILGSWTGRRGLSPKPWGFNTLLFVGHAVGATGSLLAALLMLSGALKTI
ncbi:MAG: M28 family peptidase [Verrucomicrobiae bacterium]|nr:M28 family peptidase [Verrucomicrobiae bacterium]